MSRSLKTYEDAFLNVSNTADAIGDSRIRQRQMQRCHQQASDIAPTKCCICTRAGAVQVTVQYSTVLVFL